MGNIALYLIKEKIQFHFGDILEDLVQSWEKMWLFQEDGPDIYQKAGWTNTTASDMCIVMSSGFMNFTTYLFEWYQR